MTIVFILLAIGYFFLEVFLTIRFGSDHPVWPSLVFFFAVFVFYFVGDKGNTSDLVIAVLSMLLAQILANKITFVILRKRAGNLILTYKRSMSSLIGTIIGSGFYFWLAFMASIPHTINFPEVKSAYDGFFIAQNYLIYLYLV